MNNPNNTNNTNNKNNTNPNFNKEKENADANAANENKMAEVEKKSSLPILSVGITWILSAFFFRPITTPTKIFLVAVLSYVVYLIVKKKFPPKKIEIMMEGAKPEAIENIKKAADSKLTPEERELKDLNERMDLYAIEIKLLNDSIGDAFISEELAGIEKNLGKIKIQINGDAKAKKPGHSKRVKQLSQFFDYYMPTTIKILNSYRRIEKQGLTGKNAAETKKRVEESLPFIRKAFEKELDNLFSDEMLDITTDIDVLESVLSKDGLIDKDNINSLNTVRDIKSDMKNDFF